jgi:hypothetical protein
MTLAQLSLADILQKHVTLEVESIDRMYLNVYIPNLQREANVSWFLKQQQHCPVASSAATRTCSAGGEGVAPISHALVAVIEAFAQAHQVPC